MFRFGMKEKILQSFRSRMLITLDKITKTVFKKYYLTWPEIDWFYNKSFEDYLKIFNEYNGFNAYRRYILLQLLRLVEDVPGDTAECGVYKGASSWLILAANSANKRIPNKIHHMFDSFEGLSKPKEVDGIHWKEGDLKAREEEVIENLKPFKGKFKIYKGWIPYRFQEVKYLKFSFVHIDVDLYQPTFDSIAFFYDRVNDGGIILCDDYGSSSCPGATKAINEFLEDKPEKMIYLPVGGGFIIKGLRTSEDIDLSQFIKEAINVRQTA